MERARKTYPYWIEDILFVEGLSMHWGRIPHWAIDVLPQGIMAIETMLSDVGANEKATYSWLDSAI